MAKKKQSDDFKFFPNRRTVGDRRKTFIHSVVSRQDLKEGIDLIKYLHKNEIDKGLKERLARLGLTLNKIFIHT
jgi:hypothetical protein